LDNPIWKDASGRTLQVGDRVVYATRGSGTKDPTATLVEGVILGLHSEPVADGGGVYMGEILALKVRPMSRNGVVIPVADRRVVTVKELSRVRKVQHLDHVPSVFELADDAFRRLMWLAIHTDMPIDVQRTLHAVAGRLQSA
jgi:hypothetical protein